MAKAKRAPAIQDKVYVEIDRVAYEQHGVFEPIGTPIYAPTVTTKVPRGQFEVTYAGVLFDIMRELGNRKIRVFAWLLDHKDGNNQLNVTQREIADKTDTSLPTVNDTIKTLVNAGILKRKGTVYMFSPGLMIKGSQLREAYLMRKFEEIPDPGPKPKLIADNQNGAVDAQIDGQLEIIDIEGTIGERAR